MNFVKSNTRKISMLDEDTVLIEYIDNIVISLKDAQEDYILYDQFTKKKRLKKLIISGKYTGVTSEAREFFQNENKKRAAFIIAEAIVVNSVAQRLLANFYFHFIGQSYPTKSFTNMSKAMEWLKAIEKEIEV